MILSQVPRFIEVCYKAKIVPFFFGAKGCGKSQVITVDTINYLKKIYGEDFGIIDLRLGCMEIGDLLGLPRVRKINDIEKTVYAKPDWFPIVGETNINGKKTPKRGILFLDEFNRASTNDIIQGMFQFILGRKDPDTGLVIRELHTHRFPEDWLIICAGNPDTSDYMVQSLDTSMLDRFIQISIDVEKEIAVKWMYNNLKNKSIAEFVAKTSNALGKPEDCRLNITPSARSYEFVDDMLTNMEEADFNQFGLEIAQGVLGETVGMLLYKDLQENLLRAIPADQIMNTRNFEKFIETTLSKYITNIESHTELIDITLIEIGQKIKDKSPTAHQAKNIINFLDVIPKDMSLKFFNDNINNANIIPILGATVSTNTDEFKLKMIETMGYSRKEVLEQVEELDKIIKEHINEVKKDKTNDNTK